MGEFRKILVVDDEEAVRLVTVEMLNRMGFEAIAVDGGRSAISSVSHETYDLVLLDLAMPEMSGAETLHALRQIAPRMPVLFMTGYSRDDLDELMVGEGATEVLPKPFPMQELKSAVERILEIV